MLVVIPKFFGQKYKQKGLKVHLTYDLRDSKDHVVSQFNSCVVV